MTDIDAPRRPWFLAGFFVLAGVLGIWASFSLTIDKFIVLQNPDAVLDCSVSIVVECATNLQSWQGAVFGFPNPILGLVGFAGVLALGVALLGGAVFDRWLWIVINVGVLGAIGLVGFFVYSTIFVLGTICLWCVLVWSVTIPLFLAVTGRNLAEGVFGGGRGAGRFLLSWIVPITVAIFALIAITAQLRLDVIGSL